MKSPEQLFAEKWAGKLVRHHSGTNLPVVGWHEDRIGRSVIVDFHPSCKLMGYWFHDASRTLKNGYHWIIPPSYPGAHYVRTGIKSLSPIPNPNQVVVSKPVVFDPFWGAIKTQPININPAPILSHYPHLCPGCGKPAYNAAAGGAIDCSAKCSRHNYRG